MEKQPDMICVVTLHEMIDGIPWEEFEQSDIGDLYVYVCKPRYVLETPKNERVRFSLRVGNYMSRPHKAILAQGQFVRIKAAPEYEVYRDHLNRLDPSTQDGCVYNGQYHHGIQSLMPTKGWRPTMPYGGVDSGVAI